MGILESWVHENTTPSFKQRDTDVNAKFMPWSIHSFTIMEVTKGQPSTHHIRSVSDSYLAYDIERALSI